MTELEHQLRQYLGEAVNLLDRSGDPTSEAQRQAHERLCADFVRRARPVLRLGTTYMQEN